LARYNLFWKWMREEDIGAIGIGHHADDQVETALMRLERKSSSLGARGMLPCRRWGMGNDNDLEWLGYEGMNKWIIRPLLEVSKVRLHFGHQVGLARAEAYRIGYWQPVRRTS
jgi:tRNA(Ile)-lysidine synthase TilS/MesJ